MLSQFKTFRKLITAKKNKSSGQVFIEFVFLMAIVVKRFFYPTELIGNYQTLNRGNQQFQTVMRVLPCALNLKVNLNLQARAGPSSGGEVSEVNSCH